jgi:hypothetical protein
VLIVLPRSIMLWNKGFKRKYWKHSRWHTMFNLLSKKQAKENGFLCSFFLKYSVAHRWATSPRMC